MVLSKALICTPNWNERVASLIKVNHLEERGHTYKSTYAYLRKLPFILRILQPCNIVPVALDYYGRTLQSTKLDIQLHGSRVGLDIDWTTVQNESKVHAHSL